MLQRDAADLSSARLSVEAHGCATTPATRSWSQLIGSITHGSTDVEIDRSVTIGARAGVIVTVTPRQVPGLRLVHPAVWWPYQMGAQPLYHLALDAQVGGAVSDSAAEDFGIRTVSSRLTPVRPGHVRALGYRQFAINGRPFVVRGGGWSQDMFLRYSPSRIADQLAYVKDLGLNAIRFEGNLPPDDMFEQLDRAGILALPGWQCCGRWEQDSSRWTPDAARERPRPGAARRRAPARPPERARVLPGQRRPARSGEGGALPRRLPAGRLGAAADRVGRVQDARRGSAPRARRRVRTTGLRPPTGGRTGR